VRPLNSYPLHDRAAFAFSAILYPQSPRLPLRFAFPATHCLWLGGLRAYHVPRAYLCGLGLASPPVAHHLRQVREEHLNLTTGLFGPSVSASFACSR
jgi:hypothetical protein